jgi:hypothetical protein
MSFDDYGTGQCINCGFLGKRPIDPHASECHEASAWERANGHIGDYPWSPDIPWCFVGKCHLKKEVVALTDDRKADRKVFEVITRHRACEEWYPWTEFLSPRDHHEEFKMKQLEESRKQFEERMEENRREWQKWMTEQAERGHKQSDKMMLRWTILGIVLAVLMAIMQLIGAFWAQALFRNS